MTHNAFVLAKYYMQQCSINCMAFQCVYSFSQLLLSVACALIRLE